MKLKTTIILVIVAAIGFAYIFLIEKEQFTTDQVMQRSWLVFPDFQPGSYTKIDIKQGDKTISLERTAHYDWLIREPIDVKADNTEVNGILSVLQYLKKMSSIPNVTDLKPYGLDEPAYVATFRTGPAKQGTTIHVGKKRAGGEEVYIRINDSNDTLLVSGKLLDILSQNVTDFRNKKVFDIEAAAAGKLVLRYDTGEVISCVRKGNDWRLEEPVLDYCNNERVVDVVNKIVELMINKVDFISEDDSEPAKYGFDRPKLAITLEQSGKSVTTIFGHTLDEKVYTKHEDAPTVFMLDEKVLSVLAGITLNDLRARSLCRFNPLYVSKLVAKVGDTPVTIEKTTEYDWKITSPVEVLADTETFKNILTTIQEMEIQNFVADNVEDLSPWGLENPVSDVEVFKEGDESIVHLLVGNKDEMGKLCYIRRSGENSVFMVEAEGFYDNVVDPVLALRDRLLIDYEKDDAVRLVVERKDRSFVCEKSKDDPTKWILLEPVKTDADKIPLSNIVWGLSFFKAEKYVEDSPKDLGKYGLDKPSVKVTVTYKERIEATVEERKEDFQGEIYLHPKSSEGPPVTKTVLVGNRIEPEDNSNYYAMIEGGSLVFELGWTDMNDFTAELAPTRVLPFDKERVVALSLAYNDKEVSYEYRREAWEMLKPILRDEVDRREVEVINYHLENLRAESIAHYSTDNLAQFGLDNPWFSAKVGLEDGEYTLYVGNKIGEDKYYAKSGESDFIYVVRAVDIELLMGIEPEVDPFIPE